MEELKNNIFDDIIDEFERRMNNFIEREVKDESNPRVHKLICKTNNTEKEVYTQDMEKAALIIQSWIIDTIKDFDKRIIEGK